MLRIQRFFPCQSSALSILVLQRLCPKMQRLSGHQGIRRVVQNPGWRKQSPVSLTRLQCPCACVPPRLDKCPLWALGSRTWARAVVWNRNQHVPEAAEVLCSSAQMAGPAQHLPGALQEGWKRWLGCFQESQTSHPESPQWAPLQCILL